MDKQVTIPTTSEGQEAGRLLQHYVYNATQEERPAALKVYMDYLKQKEIIEFTRDGFMGDVITLFTKAVDNKVTIIGLVVAE